MARVVESVAPEFGDDLVVEKVITKQLQGATKYQEISKELGKPAPVPSIFIEGKLIYDQTPSAENLRAYLQDLLSGTG
jgi:hypothetical protein